MTPKELYDQAIKYRQEGNFEQELSYLIQSATAGFVEAIERLGQIYQYQFNDYQKAFSYYEQAATLGSVEAIERLGSICFCHFNDYQKALSYYEQAATLGSCEAMIGAAKICSGRYSDECINVEKALSYYQKASKLGHPDASYQLFFIFREGRCDQKIDLEKAKEYEKLAIDQCNDTATANFCDTLIDKIDLGIPLTEKEKDDFWLIQEDDLELHDMHPNICKRILTSDLTNAKKNFDTLMQTLTKRLDSPDLLPEELPTVLYQIAKLNEDYCTLVGVASLELKNIASLYQKAAEKGNIDAIYYFLSNKEARSIMGLNGKIIFEWLLVISKPAQHISAHPSFSSTPFAIYKAKFLIAAIVAQGKYGAKKNFNACRLLFQNITEHVTQVFEKFEHQLDSEICLSHSWIPYDQWNTQLVRDLVDGLIYFATDKDFSSFFDKEKALKPAFMSVLSYFSKICEAQLGQPNNKELNTRFGDILEKFAFIFKDELGDIPEFAQWKALQIQSTVGKDGNNFVKIMNQPTQSLTNLYFNFMSPPLQVTAKSQQKREREDEAVEEVKMQKL